MKLVLGSASWRSRYGLISKSPISKKQITELVTRGALLGFDFIDTAPTYGDTETILGEIKPQQKIATKVTVDPSNLSSINESLNLSRKKLDVESLDLIFVHNWDNLSQTEKYSSAELLQKCILRQSIRKWGFSTYDVLELKKIKVYGWTNCNIQINSNILDQRLLEVDNSLGRSFFKKRNIEIWARSVFLQGVLLDQTLQNPFVDHPDLINFFSICEEYGLSPLELCLAYIRVVGAVDRIIVGIENVIHLNEIVTASHVDPPKLDFKILESKDIKLIDPRTWAISR
jgi:aryl-alcohol dehydrogenase-like predicted oxidoreductase